MSEKRLLLINGSPRRKKTSYSFCRTIKILAENKGHDAEIINIIDYLDGKESFDDLKAVIAQSEIVGLVGPLYFDYLPYPCIWFLEKLSNQFKSELEGKGLFVIGQCGFPNTRLIEPFIGAGKCFAYSTEMRWLGGLSYGGGAIIDGALLEELGKKGSNITSGLKLALDNALAGREIPQDAQNLITIKIPRIMYRPLAAYLNHNSRKIAKKNGVTDLKRKFYLT